MSLVPPDLNKRAAVVPHTLCMCDKVLVCVLCTDCPYITSSLWCFPACHLQAITALFYNRVYIKEASPLNAH